jgi:hypothetical protein
LYPGRSGKKRERSGGTHFSGCEKAMAVLNGTSGDSFDLLTAEIITGDFDLLNLAELDEGLNWELKVLTDENGSTDVLRLRARSELIFEDGLENVEWIFFTCQLVNDCAMDWFTQES